MANNENPVRARFFANFGISFSKTSRRVILLASLPLVGVLLYLLFSSWSGDAPPPKLVSVVSLGYTNDSAGKRCPQFSLSNLTTSPLQCLCIGPQTQIVHAARNHPTNVLWSWSAGSMSRELKPGEAIALTIQPPPNDQPWRLGVYALKPLTQWQKAVEKLEPHLPARIYSALRGDRRRSESIQSAVFGTEAPEIPAVQ